MNQETPKRGVILTTDCGTEMDDQWAIAHLALLPHVDLRGIVTTHAFNMPESKSEFSRKSAQDVIDRLGLASPPPVIAGSPVALPDRQTPRPNPGTDLILAESTGYSPESRLVVLTIGAATDTASALLLDPTLKDRIEILSMGFNTYPEGTDEWNVKNDIPAWQAMLDSGAPVTIGGADVCLHGLVLNPEQAEERLRDTGPVGGFLVKLLRDFVNNEDSMVEQVTGRPDSWPVWDEIVVAHLLGLTRANSVPRPKLLDDMQFDLSAADPADTIEWITEVDSDGLWGDLASRLREHAARS
jgi:inosine-uridine nucleoside N-ribohydrolase